LEGIERATARSSEGVSKANIKMSRNERLGCILGESTRGEA
jgi:hypothetical protein